MGTLQWRFSAEIFIGECLVEKSFGFPLFVDPNWGFGTVTKTSEALASF